MKVLNVIIDQELLKQGAILLRDWVSKLNRARGKHAKEGPPIERVALGKKREVAKSSAQKARARKMQDQS